ncbi:MAG: hypothetical protein HYX32_06140 [Actinobacteria bacterium]|nr:hypothetical protein [Actinomycetota bacterium]
MASPDDVPLSRSRDELLAQVKARGTQLRRRRHAVASGIATFLVLVVLVPAVVLSENSTRELTTQSPTSSAPAAADSTTTASTLPRGGDDQPELPSFTVEAVDDGSTSTSEAPGDTEVAAPILKSAGEDRGPSSTNGPDASPTSTIVPACRNSFDPQCGPFVWLPPLFPNMTPAVTLSANFDPPRVGQVVTFVVMVSDADGPVADECFEFETGDGTVYSMVDGVQVNGVPSCPPPPCAAPAGGWEAPERTRSTGSFTFVHTFGSAGVFALRVRARAAGTSTCANNPYADSIDVSFRITVNGTSSLSG